jgi:RNA polymerase sigma factor FliA
MVGVLSSMARSAASDDPSHAVVRTTSNADEGDGVRALWDAWSNTRDVETKELIFSQYVSYAKALAAKLFKRRPYDDVAFEDYFQFACVGLLESIDRYEPNEKSKFTTYCTARIEGAILDGIRRYTDAQEQLAFRRRWRKDRVDSLRGEQAVDSFSDLVDLTVGLAVGFMLQDMPTLLHADEHDVRSNPYVTAAAGQTKQLLATALEALPTRERNVLTYHYLHGVPFEQIAELYEISKGRVSQIHRRGLTALRAALASDVRET